MRRDNIDNRYRFILGVEAVVLTTENTPVNEISRPEHLDAGILRLRSELRAERDVNHRMSAEFDRLNAMFHALLGNQNTAMRGLMMTVGQTVRELHVIRRVLILAGATSSEQAERLYEKALPAIVELRATMALWRQREGLEIPEFSLEEEERLLNQLIHNPADGLHEKRDAEPDSLRADQLDPAPHKEVERENDER